MFYAALEATLRAYLREDYDAIPALRMMRLTEDALMQRATHLRERLQIHSPELEVEVTEARSVLGGGAAPGSTLPTRVLAVKSDGMSADQLLAQLRGWETPIIARVEDERVLLDLRTVCAGTRGSDRWLRSDIVLPPCRQNQATKDGAHRALQVN